MTKPKGPKGTKQGAGGDSSNAAPPEKGRELDLDSPTTAAEGSPSPIATLSSALDVGGVDFPPLAAVGLPVAATLPRIPEDIDAELNARERRIVLAMVNGASYAQALRQCPRAQDGEQRSQERTDAIPPHVLAAVNACLREIAAAAGLNRAWIIERTVALHQRASQAIPVVDRKGIPTGEYRYDGPTAAKTLEMLAEWQGELYPKKGATLQASDVAALLVAVAQRGRPALEDMRARVVGSQSAAAQQEDKTP